MDPLPPSVYVPVAVALVTAIGTLFWLLVASWRDHRTDAAQREKDHAAEVKLIEEAHCAERTKLQEAHIAQLAQLNRELRELAVEVARIADRLTRGRRATGAPDGGG